MHSIKAAGAWLVTLIPKKKALWTWLAIVLVTIFVLGRLTAHPAYPQARWLGVIITILWGSLIPVLVVLYHGEITEIIIARISHKHVFSRIFLPVIVGFFLSAWIGILSAFLNTTITAFATAKPSWEWPLYFDKLEGRIIFTVLLGTATLTGLTIAIARIQETAIPRPMQFGEALKIATDMIERARNDGKTVRLCAFYPCIGAVNQEDYQREYRLFFDAIKKVSPAGSIEYAFLPLRATGDTELVTDGERAKDGLAAMRTFAKDYFNNPRYNNDWESRYKRAATENRLAMEMIENAGGDNHIHIVDIVPDYHFILVGSGKKEWDDGMILLPLVAPGIPYRSQDSEPPFLAIPLNRNQLIIKSLNTIFGCIETEAEQAKQRAAQAAQQTTPPAQQPAALTHQPVPGQFPRAVSQSQQPTRASANQQDQEENQTEE